MSSATFTCIVGIFVSTYPATMCLFLFGVIFGATAAIRLCAFNQTGFDSVQLRKICSPFSSQSPHLVHVADCCGHVLLRRSKSRLRVANPKCINLY